MQAWQTQSFLSSESTAMDELQDFLRRRRQSAGPADDFHQIEQEVHRLFVLAEREALGQELSRFARDVPRIEINGERYDRVLRCETTYTSAAGPVRVERSLYRHPSGGRALCPLELQAGIIEGAWTPLAAKQASWAVAHLTPKESEDLFVMLGNMAPSKSTLDRLPKALHARWEAHRVSFESTWRDAEVVPPEAVSIGVSLDGVLVPMKDGERQGKRPQAKAQGKSPRGPAGYQEVGCGTISYYDRVGARLVTRRMARMPEPNKATLKRQLTAEVMGALLQRPDLHVVKLADGTTDNWTYLRDTLPFGDECLDFYHASDHLSDALAAAYGEGTPRYRERFDTLREVLRDAPQGADQVIQTLCRLRTRYPRRQVIHKAVAYFREHRHRMPYARLRAQHLPIGSGIVEAACKTLASQRLKRSGMRWRQVGGQAILTLRALCQSDRFDRAWDLLVTTYKQPVELPRKLIALSGHRERV
jgi:hypothetical protein